MSTATGLGANQVEPEEDVLNLDDEKNNVVKGGANQGAANQAGDNKTAARIPVKKVKITLEIDQTDLDELGILTTLGVCESKEEFIIQSMKQAKTEVIGRIKTAIKKK